MSNVKSQVHGKFKVFAGALDESNLFSALSAQVTAWAAEAKVAPKSIGVEYLETSRQLLLTLGYRDDEPAYPVRLASVSLGKIVDLAAASLTQLETKMGEASARFTNVICHELYVTADHECFMVFLEHG